MERYAQDQCPGSESIVSYIYNEMAAGDRHAFETHLVDCQACTDQFAEISVARFEVFDWKRSEFDQLATPVISIHCPEQTVSIGQRLHGLIRSAAAVPAFALVLLAIGAGYLYWISNGQAVDADSVAANPAATASVVPVADPSAGVASTQEVAITDSVPGDDGSIARTAGNRPTKNRIPSTPVRYAKQIAPQVKLANDVAVNSPPATKKLPRLGVYDDEDDTSLRLAELFDEAGPPQD